MNEKINIIIADDHALFVSGMQSLLKDEIDMVVTDIANNAKELLLLLPRQESCLVLLDINMPGMSGLEAINHIKAGFPKTKILMLSTYNEEHLIEKAKQSGANGYLLKTADKDELLQTIRQVAGGKAVFPYRFSPQQNEFDKQDTFLKQYQVTRREMDVLQLIKRGYTNQQIADTLILSIFTIETHRKNIMQKLGLKSPSALMKFIVENNL